MIKGTGHMIVSIANDRSMSIESIRKTIKESVLIAYKKYFGSNENAFVSLMIIREIWLFMQKRKL